jgi:hypothetical protein
MNEVGFEHLYLDLSTRGLHVRAFRVRTGFHHRCHRGFHPGCDLDKLARTFQFKIRLLHVGCDFGFRHL